MKRIVPAFLALSCLSCLISTTSLEAIWLASPKNFGMGNVGVAYPQDSLAAAYNPAGMVHIGDRADIGAFWLNSDPMTEVEGSTLTNANGPHGATRGKHFGSPTFGINWHPCNACDISWGLVVYSRDWFKASYKGTFPALGTTPLSMELWSGVASPCFAMKWERFSFGISANFIGQTLKVTGFENMNTATNSAHMGDVTNRKRDWTQAFSITLGGMIYLNKCWSIGGAWESKARAGHFKKYQGLIAGGRVNWPDRWRGGIHFHPNRCTNFAFDIEGVHWSQTKFFHNGFPADNTELQAAPFGDKGGPGLGWGDQVIARVGGDYTFCDWITLRAGYRYTETPVRSKHTLLNAPLANVVEHWATAGLTFKTCCGEISGFFAHGFDNEVKGRDGAVGTDFGGGTYDISNKQFAAGVSWGWGY